MLRLLDVSRNMERHRLVCRKDFESEDLHTRIDVLEFEIVQLRETLKQQQYDFCKLCRRMFN